MKKNDKPGDLYVQVPGKNYPKRYLTTKKEAVKGLQSAGL
jgi:hypothetical protein